MKLSKSCLQSLTRSTRLRLKEGACKHLKKREWLFNKLEKDMVYLLDESGLFGMGVRVESIDWEKFVRNS